MFENFGTAIVQAVGFFGVFGFFVYRLLSEKASSDSIKKNSSKPFKSVSVEKRGLFGKKKESWGKYRREQKRKQKKVV